MDVRNVQKSGNAFYIYLPADWCRNNGVTNSSQLDLDTSTEGKLLVSPHHPAKKGESLVLNMPEDDLAIINKLIVASYLNPVRSFKIKLDHEISSLDILDTKKVLGGIELVEFQDKNITCESSVYVDDPDILLRTMIRKIINMIKVTGQNHKELISRYEEEIDRSNLLINKSAIGTFMFKRHSKLKHIELFYIVNLSIYLERLVDYLISTEHSKTLLGQLMELMKMLDTLLENIQLSTTIPFVKESIKIANRKDCIQGISNNLNNIADIMIDWSVSIQVEKG